MKNILFIICVLIIAVFLVMPSEEGQVLRLRVIANSDSAFDQSEKMRVVEAVDKLFDKETFETLSEAEKWIVGNMSEIERACRETYGTDFTAELRGEKYDDGVYRSLVITLGEGRGHNFWGTLFPDISTRMSSAKSSKNKPFSVKSKGGALIETRFWIVEQILNIF